MLFKIYELEQVELNRKDEIVDGWSLSRSLSYDLIKEDFDKTSELASEKDLKDYSFLLNVFTYDTQHIIENERFDETDYVEYDSLEEYSLKEYYERFKEWCKQQTLYDLNDFHGSFKEMDIARDVLLSRIDDMDMYQYLIADVERWTLTYDYCEDGHIYRITFYENFMPSKIEDYGVFEYDDFDIEVVG